MFTFYIEAHGCSRRLMDGALITAYMCANGGFRVKAPCKADHIIIVTCGLTRSKAEACLLRIARLKSHSGRLFVYGCLPAMFPDKLGNIFNGDVLVTKDLRQMDRFFHGFDVMFKDIPDSNCTLQALGFGDDYKTAFFSFISLQRGRISKLKRFFVSEYLSGWPLRELAVKCLSDIWRLRLPVIEGVFGGVGFDPGIFSIRVSEGCSGHCSYCGIKSAIGETQSKPWEVIRFEVDRLLAAGHFRFNVCSSDLGSYGHDIGTDLPTLLTHLLEHDRRICLEFLQDLNPFWVCCYRRPLVDLAGSGRIRGVLMPLQSGSERILKLMGREIDLNVFKEVVCDIKKAHPYVRVKTQLIVGFPTETETDLKATVEFLNDCLIDQVDIFDYHEVQGAASSRLSPKIPAPVVRARVEALIRALRPGIIKAIGV